jgi:small-conductance mechanosensitive channel
MQNVNFLGAWQTILHLINGTIEALPNLLLAFLIFFTFYITGKKTNTIVRAMTDKRQKARNAGIILGKLAQSGVITVGILVALTTVFPSFQPGNLIQLLGIGSVAVGFAFHDIFQNFLAGILLLLTGPFHVGDEISVDNYEGTVEDIETRATTLRTYDGRRIVIPNSDLFTNSVTVYTAFRRRRLQYNLFIDYDEDIRQVKHLLLEALNTIEDVLKEPVPEVLVTGLHDGSIALQIHCWTHLVHQTQLLRLQDSILTTTKDTLDANNIQLSMQTQKILLETLRASKNGAQAEQDPTADIAM